MCVCVRACVRACVCVCKLMKKKKCKLRKLLVCLLCNFFLFFFNNCSLSFKIYSMGYCVL